MHIIVYTSDEITDEGSRESFELSLDPSFVLPSLVSPSDTTYTIINMYFSTRHGFYGKIYGIPVQV